MFKTFFGSKPGWDSINGCNLMHNKSDTKLETLSVTLFSPHSPYDGVHHLIELLFSFRTIFLRSYDSFHFLIQTIAAPAFLHASFLLATFFTLVCSRYVGSQLSSLEFAQGTLANAQKQGILYTGEGDACARSRNLSTACAERRI